MLRIQSAGTEEGRQAGNFKKSLKNEMLHLTIKYTVVSKPKVQKEEYEKESA